MQVKELGHEAQKPKQSDNGLELPVSVHEWYRPAVWQILLLPLQHSLKTNSPIHAVHAYP